MVPATLRELLAAATGQISTPQSGGCGPGGGLSGGPSSRRLLMDLADVAAAHRSYGSGSAAASGSGSAAAAGGESDGPGLSSSVLDVLGQVQATVQREVLAAITLNSTFADMVLDPVQVRALKLVGCGCAVQVLVQGCCFCRVLMMSWVGCIACSMLLLYAWHAPTAAYNCTYQIRTSPIFSHSACKCFRYGC